MRNGFITLFSASPFCVLIEYPSDPHASLLLLFSSPSCDTLDALRF